MLSHPDLTALLDQAARNLDTLELLARDAGEDGPAVVSRLRKQLAALKTAYARETEALTRQVLQRAVDRRVTGDRRRRIEMQTT